MKNIFANLVFMVLFVFLLILNSHALAQSVVGKKLSELKNISLTDSTIDLLIRAAHSEKLRIAKLDSINCEILITNDGIIEFISTTDTKFKTSEGLKIGSRFRILSKDLNIRKNQVIEIPGWGKYVILPSGWFAAFEFGRPIKSKSRIQFFFQDLNLLQ